MRSHDPQDNEMSLKTAKKKLTEKPDEKQT